MDDWQLLRQYVEQNSQEAFASLTRRYVNLVYSVCCRELSSPDLADDVTQSVFLILARKASGLRRGVILSGWLFQTARFAAKNAQTVELRRRNYEHAAAEQAMTDRTTLDNALWDSLEPILNQSLAKLRASDRDAVLLRYVEGRSLTEIGVTLGVSEEAARKRMARALEKLRRLLVTEGVVISGAALAALLPKRAVHAAPAHCASTVAAATLGVLAGHINMSLHGSYAYQLSEGVLRAMKIAQMKLMTVAGVTAVAIIGTTTYAVVHGGTGPPKIMKSAVAQVAGADLTPQQVVQRCEQAYNRLKSYQGTTTVIENGSVNGKAYTSRTSAVLRFVSPNGIRAEGQDANKQPFAYVSDGTDTYTKVNGNHWTKVQNAEMAIATVTGIARSAGTTIPALLLHTGWGYPFTGPKELDSAMTQETVTGHACYRVTQRIPGTQTSFWIDAKTFLLRRLVEDSSNNVNGQAVRLHQDERFTNETLNAPIPGSVFASPTVSLGTVPATPSPAPPPD